MVISQRGHWIHRGLSVRSNRCSPGHRLPHGQRHRLHLCAGLPQRRHHVAGTESGLGDGGKLRSGQKPSTKCTWTLALNSGRVNSFYTIVYDTCYLWYMNIVKWFRPLQTVWEKPNKQRNKQTKNPTRLGCAALAPVKRPQFPASAYSIVKEMNSLMDC